jgi:hypothetical protein
VKGLRVLFYGQREVAWEAEEEEEEQQQQQQQQQQGEEAQQQHEEAMEEEEEEQQQQVDSFCSWLRRHAPQIKALAITSKTARHVLAALPQAAVAAAAAAASMESVAAAHPLLPLQRLVITIARDLLDPQVCVDTLNPLLGALPHLQHLHLPLMGQVCSIDKLLLESAVAALAPLQHSASLTSLVLDGPGFGTTGGQVDAVHGQLLANLPHGLRSLTWRLQALTRPRVLDFGHLSALTHLKLSNYGGHTLRCLLEDTFTGLRQLRELELHGISVTDQLLVAHEEQLVALAPKGNTPGWVPLVLPQLKHLKALSMTTLSVSMDDLWQKVQQAPGLQELHIVLEPPDGQDGAESSQVYLQQYTQLCKLQKLDITVVFDNYGPQGLSALTQLKQLAISSWFGERDIPIGPWGSMWPQAVAALVNLEVLTMPAELTVGEQPWLTGLTRLAVLEVICSSSTDMASVALDITPLLAPEADSSGSSAGSSGEGVSLQEGRVMVVCVSNMNRHQAVQLKQAVAAAVPVLAPNKHLFLGGWELLQECGVELWPAPVAARLQQLVAL